MLEERDVLILGGGFAGAYVGRLLRERVPTIVSHENFMLYTPLLPEAASGTLEPRHTVVPLRVMCPRAELILGTVEGVDLEARTARVDGHTLRWRDLVVALGAVPRAVPEHALTFKSLEDAIQLRNHVLGRLEAADASPQLAARELTFVFVGAGYAGVEALAELSDLVDDALQYYPHLHTVPRRWVLVDAAAKILPEIPPPLGEYAAEELTRRGVEIHVGTTLERTSSDEIALGDGTVIPTRTLVWTAGIIPNPLLSELGLPLDERGRIEVDEYLHVRGQEHVWSLGDCARVPNRKAADPDPPTCQHALRQARRLAKNIEGDTRPYGYRMLGQVATLGRYKGIADVLGFRFRGFPGWFVTRSYHLYQLPLASRRLRVVADWTTSLLFRRDVVKL
ncbi:MAG TPA: NAD(P)/FAD-dependent oxidoreductase [Gaiellaceae bacterium]|nr:NAD(P)/FAD-dependent oxidoreductase [Gaiellaceae bacterium]